MAPPKTGDFVNEAKGVSGAISGSGRTSPPEDSKNLVELMTDLFGPSNGVDLELPPREPMRDPPSFD